MASLPVIPSLRDTVQDTNLTQRNGRGAGEDKAIPTSTAMADIRLATDQCVGGQPS